MILERRTVLGGLAAGLVTIRPGIGLRAQARIEGRGRSLDVLSDGHLVLPPGFVFDPMPEDAAEAIRAAFDLGAELTPGCNLTLLREGGRVVLFDAGSGPDFMPTAGELPTALEAAGVDPAEITEVILTHGHPDHHWGVLDDFGDPAFPNARHMIGRAEHDYWIDPATIEAIGEARAAFAVGAARRLEALADRVETFEDGAEVAPGVTARLTPGHTPGHMAFEIDLAGEMVTVVGDAIANHHAAFAAPALPAGQDQDMERAAATRLALLEAFATSGAPIVGFHLPGGLGRVERDADVYTFVPL